MPPIDVFKPPPIKENHSNKAPPIKMAYLTKSNLEDVTKYNG